MKLGTWVRLPDGREGTIVFNGLVGVGIKWGRHDPPESDFVGTSGGLFCDTVPDDWPWEPDALLREPCSALSDWDCVGEQYEIIEKGEK